MQHLVNLIKDARKQRGANDAEVLNLIREYLQVLILKAIYQSTYGKHLSFMGGTCLRICHKLKRFSEDLDFTLDKKMEGYSFKDLNHIICSFLTREGFEVDCKQNNENVVHKSFIRAANLLHTFGLSPLQSQKIHIKLEIDTNPVKIKNTHMESFFVNAFNELFPIIKHDDSTLFAGKICASLNRAYTKGRDFYDLIWYLNRQQEMNIGYINKSFKQSGLKVQFKNTQEVMAALQKKVETITVSDILKDVQRFLQDPSEVNWLKKYPAVFQQATSTYLNEL
jgi:predicted nucleotidyltransferase component of viral defense system